MSFVAVFHPYPGFITCWIMGLALPVAAPIHQAVGGGSVNCVLPFPPLTELKHSHLFISFAWTWHRRMTLPVRISPSDGNEMILTRRKRRSLVMNGRPSVASQTQPAGVRWRVGWKIKMLSSCLVFTWCKGNSDLVKVNLLSWFPTQSQNCFSYRRKIMLLKIYFYI